VDDHQLFREGVALLVQRLSNYLQLLQVANCDEAFALCEARNTIDFILLNPWGLAGSMASIGTR
jgi:DNA-binding NarL/FixJ family response regulator